MTSIQVKVSVGEALDKLSILKIKTTKLIDKDRLDCVTKEYRELFNAVKEVLKVNPFHIEEVLELRKLNVKLWNLENDVRRCLSVGSGSHRLAKVQQEFMEAATQISKLNDERARVKQRLNLKFDSGFQEIKSYDGFELGGI
jgi:hypothetical protein